MPKTDQDIFEVEVGEYDKNRRYEVEKGTKFVHVIIGFDTCMSPADVAAEALRHAANRAVQEFGDFRHEQVDYVVAFVTSKVLVEYRVRPL